MAFKKYCINLNAKLLIVGNAGFGKGKKSNYDDEVLNLAKGLEDKIIFTGFIHNSKLLDIHDLADVSVIPSMWDEPAGLVVVEAMASGIPIITTGSGGIVEYVNNKCSIIVKRDENVVDNIGEAILKLYYDKNLRNEMSIESRKKSREYMPNIYYKRFIEIIGSDGGEFHANKKFN